MEIASLLARRNNISECCDSVFAEKRHLVDFAHYLVSGDYYSATREWRNRFLCLWVSGYKDHLAFDHWKKNVL